MIHFDVLDFRECRSEHGPTTEEVIKTYKFLLKLKVYTNSHTYAQDGFEILERERGRERHAQIHTNENIKREINMDERKEIFDLNVMLPNKRNKSNLVTMRTRETQRRTPPEGASEINLAIPHYPTKAPVLRCDILAMRIGDLYYP